MALQLNRTHIEEDWLDFAETGYRGLFEIMKTPMSDSRGQQAGILILARDVTENRRIQHMLQERIKEQKCLYDIFALTEDLAEPIELQFQKAVDRIPEGWQYPEITSACIEFSDRKYHTSGFAESPWMQTLAVLASSGDAIRLTVAYSGEKMVFDDDPFMKDAYALAEVIVHRLVDVVDRRHVAKTLAESIERYRLIADNTGDVIWILDPARMVFTYVSPSVYKLRGYTPEEVMAEPMEKTMTPESLEKVMEKLAIHTAKLRAGDPSFRTASMEINQTHKDGRIVPTEVAVTLLTDGQGEITQVIGITRVSPSGRSVIR